MKLLISVATATIILTGAAFAGQPVDPGGFGQDRAAGVEANREIGAAPGASAWGHEAGNRGSSNGELNREWKTQTGGDPTHK